jgi:hypothetical protein
LYGSSSDWRFSPMSKPNSCTLANLILPLSSGWRRIFAPRRVARSKVSPLWSRIRMSSATTRLNSPRRSLPTVTLVSNSADNWREATLPAHRCTEGSDVSRSSVRYKPIIVPNTIRSMLRNVLMLQLCVRRVFMVQRYSFLLTARKLLKHFADALIKIRYLCGVLSTKPIHL